MCGYVPLLRNIFRSRTSALLSSTMNPLSLPGDKIHGLTPAVSADRLNVGQRGDESQLC